MFWSVVGRDPCPYFASLFSAKIFDERLLFVGIQIVHHQMDSSNSWIRLHDLIYDPCKLPSFTIFCDLRDMVASFRFHHAKSVRRSIAFVLAITFCDFTRGCRSWRSNFGVKNKRAFIYTYNWFPGIVISLINGKDIFHFLFIFVVDLRHAPHFFLATASSRGLVTKS